MTLTAPQHHPFLSHLADVRNIIAPRLVGIVKQSTGNQRLRQAMLHGVQGSGKFVRPFLVLTFANCVARNCPPPVIDTAVAVELVHSYSLIHDDLPSMDNADLRRGLPSCWRAFDEATAILAGDALIPLAYELLANLRCTAEIRLNLVRELSEAIGGKGLVAGQMMDLYPSSHMDNIRQMQLLKTGALLSLSCVAGSLLSEDSSSRENITNARQFGLNLGLIYQITDDILSENGNVELTGKPVQNDQEKITFISTLGIKGATALLKQLLEETHQIADKCTSNTLLHYLLDFLSIRTF